MADETRVVRTAGVYGNFVLPGLLETDDGPADLVLHPEGTEITFEQWKTVREAAVANQVVVRLDEDFPGELYAAEIEKAEAARAAEATAGTPEQKPSDPTPTVDGSDAGTSGGGRRSRTQNGG